MEQIYVFGKGNFYRERELLINSRYSIQAFVDNQVLEGEIAHYKGIPVYNPNHLLNLPELPILLMGKQFIEMFQQLKDMNIQLSRLIFGIMIPPYSGIEDNLFGEGGYVFCENGGGLVYCSCDDEKTEFASWDELTALSKKELRKKYYKKDIRIKQIAEMPTSPICRDFGLSRGTAIDRVYIERFLEQNKSFIKGQAIEIAENTYTLKYGEEKVEGSHILHLKGWGKNAIKGNLATGEGIPENMFDSAIITQTLMFIYDIESTAKNIYKMLKKDGTALVTVSGISQISRYDADNWGSFFSFHEDAIRRLFIPIFGEGNVIVNTYGNVKTAIALLYGLCSEELKDSDFTVNDEDYPVIISAVLHKE